MREFWLITAIVTVVCFWTAVWASVFGPRIENERLEKVVHILYSVCWLICPITFTSCVILSLFWIITAILE